jgi:molybdopterin-guanine dinucleotide biosynthesis protein A
MFYLSTAERNLSMRKKYKIYSVILTGIILTGCKSVRMTSQDRQQFMPNGISVAQQLLEETEEATQAKSLEKQRHLRTTQQAKAVLKRVKVV